MGKVIVLRPNGVKLTEKMLREAAKIAKDNADAARDAAERYIELKGEK